MRRWRLMVPALAVLLLAAFPLPVGANHNADQHRRMTIEFTSPNAAVNSDLAFWGKHAFVGYYRGDRPVGGVRIFDISDPANPVLVKDVRCDGLQNDPILWDRNGNGIADLMFLAVDRTMASPECGAPRTAHDDPNGWEGFRIFRMSDNPANPFATVQQIAAVYQDCGSHTITLWPGLADQGKLIVYSSSYPLRPGPTCGQANFDNMTNPYDPDPGSPGDPLHGVIQVVEVPLNNPTAWQEIAQPQINYPGDPDNKIDWCERGLCAPGILEPAARACHDIMVHVRESLAAGACAEQGQVWKVLPNGVPDTANPIQVDDDRVTSGGSGNLPGAVDFFHSATFNNEATIVNWIDESFGDGCPPFTTYQPRPWNPAGGTHRTGRMFFVHLTTGTFLSEFQVGNVRPEPGAYCSAHMGLPVQDVTRDLLVNAWYMGGVDVIDFTNPRRPEEIAFYDIAPDGPTGSDNWSAYSYVGPRFRSGRGIPVYASDGVHNPDTARGMVVFRTLLPEEPTRVRDHLNPQTME